MPFGLVKDPATFQWLKEICLGDLQLIWCLIYLNNIIVFLKTPKDDLVWLRTVFEKLKEAGLKLKPSRHEFFKKSEGGGETDDSKIKVIWECPTPKTVTEVRSFLGFTSYYHQFIYKYAQLAWPLYKLISGENTSKQNKAITWDECEEAFRKLKEICTTTPILAYADFSKPFKLHTGVGSNSISKSGWGWLHYRVCK